MHRTAFSFSSIKSIKKLGKRWISFVGMTLLEVWLSHIASKGLFCLHLNLMQ